jgi:hypothetical protein
MTTTLAIRYAEHNKKFAGFCLLSHSSAVVARSQMSSPEGTQELLTHDSLDGDVDSVVRHYMVQNPFPG